MSGLLECCYELMQLELRAHRPENLIFLLDLYEMIDMQFRYGIIEERSNDAYIEGLSKYPKQREFLFDYECKYKLVSESDNISIWEVL